MNTDAATTAVMMEAASALVAASTTVSEAVRGVVRCDAAALGPLVAPFLTGYLDGLDRAAERISECADQITAAADSVLDTHDLLDDTDAVGAAQVTGAVVGAEL